MAKTKPKSVIAKPLLKATATPIPKTTSAVPEALLRLITSLSATEENARHIVSCALFGLNSVVDARIRDKNVAKIVAATKKGVQIYDIDEAIHIGLISSITEPTKPTKSVSPHAPVHKGAKKPYWLKVVSSYDPSQPNGYGVKGKFVSLEEIKGLPYGTIIVAQTKHQKKCNLFVMTRSRSGKGVALLDFPLSSPNKPIGVEGVVACSAPANYTMLFAVLRAAGVAETRKPIPF